jgi:Rv0078B-related antitoxin
MDHPSDSDADLAHIEHLRSIGPAERLRICMRLTQEAIDRTRAEIRRRNPGISETEVRIRFVEEWYGAELAQKVREHLERRGS